jgi:hypothetical protein
MKKDFSSSLLPSSHVSITVDLISITLYIGILFTDFFKVTFDHLMPAYMTVGWK